MKEWKTEIGPATIYQKNDLLLQFHFNSKSVKTILKCDYQWI